MLRYQNTKVNVRSLDGDIDYFDIVAGVKQGDLLDYVLQTFIDLMKENGFTLAKKKKESEDTPVQKYYGLRWWHSASGKYTHQSRNPAT